MLSMLGKRAERKRRAQALYACAAAQALVPHFYARWGVPDSFDGRFEMLSLHMALIWRRLRGQGSEGAKLAQACFDAMFVQMDRTLRERGVGDLGVPRHVKRMMKAYKGRAMAYDAALCAADDPGLLRQALIRNTYGTVTAPSDMALRQMAAYIKSCDRFTGLEEGRFPRPEDSDEERTGGGDHARVAA